MERLLFATDGSEHSERAFEVAVRLAKALGASLEIVSVVPTHPSYTFGSVAGAPPVTSDEEAVRFHTEIAARLRQRAEHEGVAAVRVGIKEGDPAGGILAEAEGLPADLVVVGARGVSAAHRLLLGSVSHAVVTQSRRPVLTVRGSAAVPGEVAATGPDRIVVATDGSPGAARAVSVGIELGRALRLGLRLISVVPAVAGLGLRPDRERAISEMLERDAVAVLARERERATRAGLTDVRTEVLRGSAADSVLDYVGDSARTLVVAGSRGRSRARRLLLGSVSSALLHQARGMVLIVPEPPHRPRPRARNAASAPG